MANLVIPAVGAFVGSFFGPLGANIGWMVGSALTAKDSRIEQPSVGDIQLTTANHGTPLPIVIGSQRVAGNIIWYGGKKKYTKEQEVGGKGGGSSVVVTSGYTVSFAVAICKGPILGISKVWNGGQLIIDSANGTLLPGTLYLGDNSQLPDPTMQAVEGAGSVPAYRGIAYMVMTDYDLGNTLNMPQFSFLVHKPQGVI